MIGDNIYEAHGERIFEAGEVRRFGYRVTSCVQSDPLIITSAAWSLKCAGSGTVADSGTCEVTGDVITMIVSLAEPGDYFIEVIAEIPPETVIERFPVRVRA